MHFFFFASFDRCKECKRLVLLFEQNKKGWSKEVGKPGLLNGMVNFQDILVRFGGVPGVSFNIVRKLIGVSREGILWVFFLGE